MASPSHSAAPPPRFSFDTRRLRPTRFRRLLAATAGAFLLIAVVPPFRAAAAAGLSRGILFVASPLAPDIGGFDRLPQTSRVVAADGTLLAQLDQEHRVSVRLDELPPHVRHAVLAAEDETFYEHSGVEPTAVFRAIVRTAQGTTQGGSTITQQLAKINYTTSERTILRKLREVLYASRLEREFSKDELLVRYLNQVYFGEGAYGIGAAARAYFGVEPDGLTPAQAAFLAGRIRAPGAVDVRRNPEPAVERRNQVLANMRAEGWLSERAFATARRERFELATTEAPRREAKAPHFVELVKREAKRINALGGSPESRTEQLFTGGYTIETTLDVKAYDAAVASVGKTLPDPGDPSVAVVTVEPGDGAIRNLFGGLTFDRKFDVASQGRRQPGSAFKPFVYLAAVRQGIDPRSTFEAESPRSFEYRGERFDVDNYEGKGSGRMNADDGLVHSVNTVYMGLGLETGPPNVMQTALTAKAPADSSAITPVASVALGGLKKGVTPLEMAAAYATFAAEGVYAEPHAITRIKDRQGTVVFTHEPDTTAVFEPEEVGVLNNPLQRVITEGTGQGAAIGRPLAGKTGTTQEYGDAWFVGFVPQRATAVWVGHADAIRPMDNVHGRRVSGGSFPAAIFSDVMRAATKGLRVEQIATASPDDLDLRRVIGQTATTNEPPASTSSTSSTSTSLTHASTTSSPATTAAPTTTAPTRRSSETSTTTTTASTPSSSSTSTTSSSSTTTTSSPP